MVDHDYGYRSTKDNLELPKGAHYDCYNSAHQSSPPITFTFVLSNYRSRLLFQEESELSSKRWASAPRRPDSPCVLGAPTSREAAGPPVQLEPVDLSVKTPVVLQVPRYSPAAIIGAAARRVPSPSTTPTPPPLCVSTGE
ncbi:hypothetical protein KPH14_004429 [Odynerus spinipes]|uniref:Uncharacterized protein n=1 Tax=Odynerus spinipes TaxID=1348599 RepID=A0AAD9RZD6_9HYME|nr:hypothetical protein KPH14_004429 [Odynerus spinipes]